MNTAPNSVDSERALLESMILDPTKIDEVANMLTGANFSDPMLGHCFNVVATAHQAEQPVGDIGFLLPELRRNAVDDSIANMGYLSSLVSVGVKGNVLHYAKEVRRCHVLRKQESLAHELLKQSRQHDADPERIATWLEAQQTGMPFEQDQIRTINEISLDYIDAISQPEYRNQVIWSGLPSIDETVGGWMPGELVILAARTSVGKTALAMQMAMHSASHGKSVLFVSLEMKDKELIGRILCGRAGVNGRRVRTGSHGSEDIKRIQWAAAQVHDYPLRVFSGSGVPMSRIKANAKRVKSAAGLDLLVVDYLGLVKPSDRKIPRQEQVAQISCDLKQIAQSVDVPVLALHQLNREADKGEPQLSHLRESGAIEQDADCVLFIHRDKLDSPDTELIVAKHRHGETGRVSLRWIGSRTCFEDVPNCEEWKG
jgi:replicative DNA helicase